MGEKIIYTVVALFNDGGAYEIIKSFINRDSADRLIEDCDKYIADMPIMSDYGDVQSYFNAEDEWKKGKPALDDWAADGYKIIETKLEC